MLQMKKGTTSTLRIKTLRPWLKVDRRMEGDQVIDQTRSVIEVDTVLTVDFGLGRELIANGKAELTEERERYQRAASKAE